ncbi:hypothetical protein GCM10018952_31000 [Streptosporangium vulgare]
METITEPSPDSGDHGAGPSAAARILLVEAHDLLLLDMQPETTVDVARKDAAGSLDEVRSTAEMEAARARDVCLRPAHQR